MSPMRQNGNHICPWCCLCTGQQCTPQQVYPHLNLRLANPRVALLFHPQMLLTRAPIQLSFNPSFAQLQDIVAPNVAQARDHQQSNYDHSTHPCEFQVDDPVWLSIPTAGKLDPHWEGQWGFLSILFVKGATTYKISDSIRAKVVHANQLQHLQPCTAGQPL